MTQKEKSAFERGMIRLKKSGLVATVVQLETITVYLVPSQSHPGTTHCVYMEDGKFVCKCEGGKPGNVCVHKLAAYVASSPETQQTIDRVEHQEKTGRDVFDVAPDEDRLTQWHTIPANQAPHWLRP